jgi:hypothetical protein
MRVLCLSVLALALALGWTFSAARAENEFGAFVVACQRAPTGCVGAVPTAGEFGPTPDAARNAALAACATTTPSAFCRVILQFKRGCAYIASGLNETTKMGGWAIASNKADARVFLQHQRQRRMRWGARCYGGLVMTGWVRAHASAKHPVRYQPAFTHRKLAQSRWSLSASAESVRACVAWCRKLLD